MRLWNELLRRIFDAEGVKKTFDGTRLEQKKSKRHFSSRTAKRPGNCANRIPIRPNPGTFVCTTRKVASRTNRRTNVENRQERVRNMSENRPNIVRTSSGHRPRNVWTTPDKASEHVTRKMSRLGVQIKFSLFRARE